MRGFEHDKQSTLFFSHDRQSPIRPPFVQSRTADRLRECERRLSIPSLPNNSRKPRRSVFREEGLDDVDSVTHCSDITKTESPKVEEETVKDNNTTFDNILKNIQQNEVDVGVESPKKSSSWYSKIGKGTRPKMVTTASAPPGTLYTIPRVALIVFLIALVVPAFRYSGGNERVPIAGVDAGVIMKAELVENGSAIEGRQTSPTDVCTRWAHMSALVNGTLYIYGGEATTEIGQTSNTWNNNFLTLDLTKSWEISSPSLTGLPQPSGPPAVALGSLWHSFDSLFVYGGEFSDDPAVSPLPVSTWEYTIQSATWTQFTDPVTSAGNASDPGGEFVQRAAEGAAISVAELGLSWYFGGHLDLYTTEGWSNQIARVYLKSLLEFTHPGYANSGVQSLGTTNAAPSGGVYRNITQGGLQDAAGFTERADGSLVYIPGWGESGIILGLAGGTNTTFTEMNVIDVYDIANSQWYKQATSGPSPPIRVNPCTVVAVAPDGTSFNVYLYGGQNLIPFGSQIQYSDMWILTIPSFTWIQVDMTGQSQPPARAGHTCNMWDSQMVVVGGYVGQNISCDSPGIYVFDTSSLQWTNSFTSLPGSPFSGGSSSGSSVIDGSYGYQVPGPVQSVVGGSSEGGATATTPAAGPASVGPIATGKPPTFTITQPGSTVIQTAQSTATATVSNPAPPAQTTNTSSNDSKKQSEVIAASVTAGVLAFLAGYLAFCTWLYRRQLKQYQDHLAMAQRETFNNSLTGSADGSGDLSAGVRASNMSQIPGGPVFGPFGTTLRTQSGSAGRPSLAESHSGLTPASTQVTPVDSSHGSFVGAGTLPPLPKYSYERLSEEGEMEDTEYHGAQHFASGPSAHSSTVDLLGGQEPSFFSVVLNPRRTLRVVNSD